MQRMMLCEVPEIEILLLFMFSCNVTEMENLFL